MKITAKNKHIDMEILVDTPVGEKFSGIIIKGVGDIYKKGVRVTDFSENYTFHGLDGDLLDDELKNNKSVLLKAESIVNNDRNEQYGDANKAFELYSEILKTTFGIELTPSEICKVMISVKLGRLKYKYKEDSIIDTCGYLELLNRLENKDNE